MTTSESYEDLNESEGDLDLTGSEPDVAEIEPLPEPQTASHLLGVLLAAVVVVGSAGVGYMASRVWPMTSFSASASARNAKVFEPMSSRRPAAGANGIAKQSPEHPQPAAAASLADQFKSEPQQAS